MYTKLVVGGVCGLAWATGLRGLMAEVAGQASTVSWTFTFGFILLPGVIVGVLLGWAEHLRTRPVFRTGVGLPLRFVDGFWPGQGDVEVGEDGALGVGEAVQGWAGVGVGEV
jgi:hypothetical protein